MNGNGKGDPCRQGGTFACGGCSYYTYMLEKSHLILPNGESFYLKHFANCRKQGVVYMITCDCSSFYVGKPNKNYSNIYIDISVACKHTTRIYIWEGMLRRSMGVNLQKCKSQHWIGYIYPKERGIAIRYFYKQNRDGYTNQGPLHLWG